MRPGLVYLHGFRSSPASVKATQLREAIAALPEASRPRLEIPDLQGEPAAAVAVASQLVGAHAAEGPVTVVGSSLGGFYATWVAERFDIRAVLVNPAVRPFDDLAPYVGWQTNLHTGARFRVTPADFAALRALAVPKITRPSRYLLLLETGDEVLDYRAALRFYAGAWQSVQGGGNHSLAGYAALLPAILRFAGVEGPATTTRRDMLQRP